MTRTKGSKSKSGVPIRGLQEAIELAKMAFDKHGDKSMPFSEIAESMKLPKGISTPIMGALVEYGLVEKSELGWRISAEGKNAIFGDIASIKKCFTKISLFGELYHKYGDKAVTAGVIESDLNYGRDIALIKLHYALNPPDKNEIHKLIAEVSDALKDEDTAVVTLVKSIKENIDKKEIAKILFDNLSSILSAKYPFLLTETKNNREES